MRRKMVMVGLVCLLPFLAGPSCVSGGHGSVIEQTSAAAKDHIMLVRQQPPTFGFRRLIALAEYYPDLGVFIRTRGLPGFFAETSKGRNSYFILYYPEIRQAFACRSGEGSSRQVEFSGPYPMTDNEIRTLERLRSGDRSVGFGKISRISEASN